MTISDYPEEFRIVIQTINSLSLPLEDKIALLVYHLFMESKHNDNTINAVAFSLGRPASEILNQRDYAMYNLEAALDELERRLKKFRNGSKKEKTKR